MTKMPTAEENAQALREMRESDTAYRLRQAEAEIDYLSCRVKDLQRQLADSFDELCRAREKDR